VIIIYIIYLFYFKWYFT